MLGIQVAGFQPFELDLDVGQHRMGDALVKAGQGRLQVFEKELAELKAVAAKEKAALLQRFREIKGLYKRKQLLLRRFEECVKEQLKDAEHADRLFLLGRFPQYEGQRRARSISVRKPASIRVAETPHEDHAAWAGLERPHPRRTGRAAKSGGFDSP